jgi:hypothetical protein
MQMHEDPFFFEKNILNIHKKSDIAVEQWQLAFDYGLCKHKSGNDRKEEKDGKLILMIGTIKYLQCGPYRCKNHYEMKVIFYYYCNYDSSDIFFHFPANI